MLMGVVWDAGRNAPCRVAVFRGWEAKIFSATGRVNLPAEGWYHKSECKCCTLLHNTVLTAM